MIVVKAAVLSLIGTATLGSAQWQPTPAVETRSLDTIYAAAQKESGPLVVKAGGDAAHQWDGVIQAFQQRFPKIALDWEVDLSKYHDSRLDREFYARNETADVALLQTLHDPPRWKAQNRLLYYKPATWADLYAGERDPDGAYMPAVIFGFGTIKYDTSKVAAADVPSDFGAFADPKWRGKLVLTYPNDDDAIAYLFSKLVSHYGFGWLDALVANDVHWVRGTHTPAAIIAAAHGNASDARSVTFTTLEGDAPFFGARTATEPPNAAMSWSQTAAIFARTTRPERARLLLSWLASDGFQRSRRDAGGFATRASLDEGRVYRQAGGELSGFRDFMLRRDVVDWWRLQFETTLGTAQGPSPLEVYD